MKLPRPDSQEHCGYKELLDGNKLNKMQIKSFDLHEDAVENPIY